jgi:hypothetical protein
MMGWGMVRATKDGRVASPPGCEASPSAASGVFAGSHPSRKKKARRNHGVIDEPVYDRPEPAIDVLKAALCIDGYSARKALSALVKAGYFIAPRDPTNAMLDAYIGAYGLIPRHPRTIIIGIGKARKRWAAMGQKGTAMALSVKRAGSFNGTYVRDSGRPPEGENAVAPAKAVECEAGQSGGSAASASPIPLSDHPS